MTRLRKSAVVILRWLVLLGLLISAAITYGVMTSLEQFYVVDQQVIVDPAFHEPDRYWKQKNNSVVSYTGATVNIDNSDISSDVISQKIKIEGPLFVRFSVEAGGEGIEPGAKHWSGGAASVVFFGKNGARLGQNTVVKLKNTSPIQSYSKVFYLNKKVASVVVNVRFLNAKGRFSVRSPELSILAELPKYKNVKMFLFVFWSLVALCLTIWFLRVLPIKTFVWICVWSVLVILGVLIPGGIISGLNTEIFDVLPRGIAASVQTLSTFFFGSFDSNSPSAGISKIGHFLVFLLIGILVGKSFRTIGIAYGIALMTVFAIVTESLQTLVFGRSTSLRDVYIDLSGGLLGITVGIGYIVVMERLRQHAQPS